MLSSSRLSLIVAVIGLAVLVGLLLLEPREVDESEIRDLEKGTYVSFSGFVKSQRIFDGFSVLVVDDLEVTCACEDFFKGQRVRVEGLVEIYDGTKQVKALRITGE